MGLEARNFAAPQDSVVVDADMPFIESNPDNCLHFSCQRRVLYIVTIVPTAWSGRHLILKSIAENDAAAEHNRGYLSSRIARSTPHMPVIHAFERRYSLIRALLARVVFIVSNCKLRSIHSGHLVWLKAFANNFSLVFVVICPTETKLVSSL